MIRVLHVFYCMSNGGVESFVMNYYRHIDRNKIQFDFLTSVDTPGYYDEEITEMGGRLFRAFPLKRNPVRNFLDIVRIVRSNQYDIVHRHTANAFGYYELHAAKIGGAKHLILHAHNPVAESPTIHRLSKMLLKMDCYRFACSEEAGAFLFGKRADVQIIKNAIETDNYVYNQDIRKIVRKQLGIEARFVVGHVGRFEAQKNHTKLLRIFKEIVRLHPNSELICVGDGTIRGEMAYYAVELGIQDNILFLGNRDDVCELINGFDCFCFPSLYEGFSVALIEAQTNGLNCFTSKDFVPESANITGNVHYIPLAESDTVWAKTILSCSGKRTKNAEMIVKNAGCDVNSAVKWLEAFYCQAVDGERSL